MGNENNHVYITRGALLACDMGSHKRRLNLPQSHGVYINNNPLINDSDCTLDNISYFGVCASQTPPKNAVSVCLVKQEGESKGQTVTGSKCCPNIVGKWNNVHGQTVTTDSYLICNCGGIIYPCSSGQEYKD